MKHRHHHHRHRAESSGKMGKILGHGDLKYLILHLLNEGPRHGYDIIKALEELSHKAYSPSPGSIYPTLTFLEESGFATSTTEDNKKLYSITAEGKENLRAEKEFVTHLVSRFSMLGEKMSRLNHMMGREEFQDVGNESRPSIRRSMHRLKSELFTFVDAKSEVKKKITEIIDQATEEIKKLKA